MLLSFEDSEEANKDPEPPGKSWQRPFLGSNEFSQNS